MSLEGGRDAGVDAQGVDAECLDLPAFQQPFAGVAAEAGKVQHAGRVGASVGGGVGNLGTPAGVHQHGSPGVDPPMTPFVISQIGDRDDGVGILSGFIGDIDDHGGHMSSGASSLA